MRLPAASNRKSALPTGAQLVGDQDLVRHRQLGDACDARFTIGPK
jgi:hypothetical protein